MAYTKYSLTPANNTATPPDGAPEGMLPSAVNDTMRDMMAQIRDVGDGIRNGTYTMTAPVITGGSITGVALSGNTFTNPVITGGSINNTPIGASTANTGAFTTLSASGVATFSAGTVSAPAITTTGDTNTGIFFPAADTIAFTEGGVESMRIDSAGNVGIGTSSPSAKLDIQQSTTDFVGLSVLNTNNTVGAATSSQIRMGITNSVGASYVVIRAQEQSVDNYPDIVFGAQNAATTTPTERMRIDFSGNVGIGTSSPTNKLDVVGNMIVGDGGNTRGLYVGPSGFTGAFLYRADGNCEISPRSGYSLLFMSSPGGTERMRIDSSGNVGIGVTSYAGSGALAVVKGATDGLSGTAFRTASFYSTTAANADQPGIVLGYDTSGAGVIAARTNSTGQPLAFWTYNGSGWFERMRITSDGKLLVGTTSLLTTDDTGGIYWSSATGSGGVGGFEFRNTSTSTNSDANPALIIIKGSTTYTSSQRFIQFNANAGSQAMGGIVGNGATNAQFISLSDIRDKENIEPITGSLNKIVALNPVEFDWKQTGEHINAGFIAQEVETVFPEYVVDNVANAGEEERKGITGGMSAGFIAHLVKAIQEQQAMIEELKQEVALLKSK